jgi:Mce-associated membrane protein
MSSDKTNSPVENDGQDADATEAEITESSATEIDATEADKATADEPTDGDEVADSDESADEPEIPGEAFQEGKRRSVGRLVAVLVLAVLLVGSIAGAASVYFWVYRPDQQALGLSLFKTDVNKQIADRQKQVTDAARDGTVALLSYAPESLDKDLANAKSHLTGEFLKYYSQFTDQIVAPAAKQKGVKTEATVARAAVSELHADDAVVLVFVNQVTTSKDRPDPALATSSVVVKLSKTDGRWLISEFNPV